MKEKLLTAISTSHVDQATLLMRVFLGVVIFAHGAQKLFGWYGGFGFAGTMGFFTGKLGIPYIFALAAILTESIGALSLIAGLFTRFLALLIGITIFVAGYMASFKHGFFMNWFGKQAGEGYEYHLLVFGLALGLIFLGGGRWSIDYFLLKKIKPE